MSESSGPALCSSVLLVPASFPARVALFHSQFHKGETLSAFLAQQLVVEVGEVRHQVLDHIGVRQGLDLDGCLALLDVPS